MAEADFGRLRRLLADASGPGPALLRRELDRAILLKDDEPPWDFARIGSLVEYVDLGSGHVRRARLSWPEESSHGTSLSVITCLGAALVGLCPGAIFGYTDEQGQPSDLQIMDVRR